jgi:hypothetical protein
MQFIDLAVQSLHEQAHQRAHLAARTPPVFTGERKQRQRRNAAPGTGLDDLPGGAHARAVTGLPRQ